MEGNSKREELLLQFRFDVAMEINVVVFYLMIDLNHEQNRYGRPRNAGLNSVVSFYSDTQKLVLNDLAISSLYH